MSVSVLSYMNIHITSMDISKRYFGFALTDPIVIHTIFGVASMMWAIVVPDPKRIQNEGYKQKALAISGIQARLEEKDTSNVVVGAISNLSQMEVRHYNFTIRNVSIRSLTNSQYRPLSSTLRLLGFIFVPSIVLLR